MDAHLSVLRVNKVHAGGPADECGLQAESDFILAAKASESDARKPAHFGLTEFHTVQSFAAYVADREPKQRSIILCVYSSEMEKVRDVQILPNRHWGGQGMLGCDVAQGFLHPVPGRRRNLWSQENEG